MPKGLKYTGRVRNPATWQDIKILKFVLVGKPKIQSYENIKGIRQ
jgi:hypothetical protein